jgi:hypothetical protein
MIAVTGASLLAVMFANARADPILRHERVVVRGWPLGAAAIRVLVWSDLHLGNLVTDRSRLAGLWHWRIRFTPISSCWQATS